VIEQRDDVCRETFGLASLDVVDELALAVAREIQPDHAVSAGSEQVGPARTLPRSAE
jgi:hypothetical protein